MTDEGARADVPIADEWEAGSAAGAVLDCCRFADADDLVTLAELIGADRSLCNCQDDLGRTPLHMAAANGHAAVISQLLQFKPEANKKNCEGNTALHYSAMHNHLECARLLLDAGWKVSIRNNHGRTALQEISERQLDEMEILLLKHDDELDTYENSAANVEVTDCPELESPPVAAPATSVQQQPTGVALDEVE